MPRLSNLYRWYSLALSVVLGAGAPITGPSVLYQTSRDFSTGLASVEAAGAGVSPAPAGSDRNKGNSRSPTNVPSAKKAQIFFRACFVTVAMAFLLSTDYQELSCLSRTDTQDTESPIGLSYLLLFPEHVEIV